MFPRQGGDGTQSRDQSACVLLVDCANALGLHGGVNPTGEVVAPRDEMLSFSSALSNAILGPVNANPVVGHILEGHLDDHEIVTFEVPNVSAADNQPLAVRSDGETRPCSSTGCAIRFPCTVAQAARHRRHNVIE